MQNALPIATIIAAVAAGIFMKGISTPGSAMSDWFDNEAVPAMQDKVRAFQRLPYVRLLDWEDQNSYHPRPTLRQLEVVSPAAAGYSPEELSEIFPTH